MECGLSWCTPHIAHPTSSAHSPIIPRHYDVSEVTAPLSCPDMPAIQADRKLAIAGISYTFLSTSQSFENSKQQQQAFRSGSTELVHIISSLSWDR